MTAPRHPESEQVSSLDLTWEQLELERLRANLEPRLIAYDVPLRPGLLVRITLPTNLTPVEAERLAGIIRSVAFHEEATS